MKLSWISYLLMTKYNRKPKIDMYTLLFIRASKFEFRLTVLNFLENLRLDCSYFVLNLIGC